MPTISMKNNMRDLLRGADLDRRQQSVAAMRALNVAARGLRTDAGRELHKRYPKLSTRDVNSLIAIQFASRQVLTATVVVRGRPLSLVRFKAGVVTKRGSGGVHVNVKGTKKFIRHAWVQDMKSKAGDDYQVLFVREGPQRLPIKALRTIDIPNAMNIAEVRAILDDLVHNRFDKEFARQVRVIGGI